MNEMELVASKVIVFELENEEYVIPVEKVRSIERLQKITRVPRTKKFIKGVINLRGVITPIIDLRKLFDMDERPYSDHTRIIIITQEDYEVGLIVDAANDVLDLPSDSIEPQPDVVGAVKVDYIDGVAMIDDRLLILLNLEQVLEVNHQSEMVIG
ncbi:chemotaxis protein CheW [Bacillus sp. PS06]|uniref:chemotaxis protein CheW n=1 Tax=Bacillus sp. PS06 TaxID=2764176 RepID=UPI0017874174|nr:chemotaxis protein CheW [Bacillus sp. PS06]MBD8068278.1 chemotaxis protein CheW [Bacillus sp. PS06]